VNQGGQVQPNKSDMRLLLNMAKMAKGGFSDAEIEETQDLIRKPHTNLRAETKRAVEFTGHKKVKVAIECYPAMVCKNHSAGCLPCQSGTAKN
jgi:hypothetical protein